MTWLRRFFRRDRGEVGTEEAAQIRKDAARDLAQAIEQAERSREAVSQSQAARLAYFTHEVRRALGGGHR